MAGYFTAAQAAERLDRAVQTVYEETRGFPVAEIRDAIRPIARVPLHAEDLHAQVERMKWRSSMGLLIPAGEYAVAAVARVDGVSLPIALLHGDGEMFDKTLWGVRASVDPNKIGAAIVDGHISLSGGPIVEGYFLTSAETEAWHRERGTISDGAY